MADVVNQRRGQSHLQLVIPNLTTMMPDMPLDDGHQLPRGMEYANAVGEPAVGGAGIDEVGKSKLADAAQALERTGLDDAPEGVLELVDAELNEVVERIAGARCSGGYACVCA